MEAESGTRKRNRERAGRVRECTGGAAGRAASAAAAVRLGSGLHSAVGPARPRCSRQHSCCAVYIYICSHPSSHAFHVYVYIHTHHCYYYYYYYCYSFSPHLCAHHCGHVTAVLQHTALIHAQLDIVGRCPTSSCPLLRPSRSCMLLSVLIPQYCNQHE